MSVTRILLAVLAATVAVEALFVTHHPPLLPWHGVPGFNAGLGLVSCIVVVILSKAIGRAALQVPEDLDGG